MAIEDTAKVSAGVPYLLRRKPYSTSEDVKNWWREAGKVYADSIDRGIYAEQEDFFIKTIKEELDTTKIEKVLEVGVGYGRIARLLLHNFPSIIQYDGLDISEEQIAKSIEYAGQHHPSYMGYKFDFDDMFVPHWPKYDLVISVETMTCLPYDVQPWIEKMIALSKKYVVNLDHYTNPRRKSIEDNILRNWHEYNDHYTANRNLHNLRRQEVPHYSQYIFMARVK